MNRCISGQAASNSQGSAPSTCAVCSVMRKNAATARNPAQTMPVLLRQNPVMLLSVMMRLPLHYNKSKRGRGSGSARREEVVERSEDERDVPAPRETLRKSQANTRPALELEP